MAEFHSIRLFPKMQGATAYKLSGVAARCDWVLLSDRCAPFTHLHCNRGGSAPRHVFLSLRNPKVALTTFASDILPRIKAPFVLVSGSEDVTLPRQLDKRLPAYTPEQRQAIRTILAHPLVLHWFAENLDADTEARLSPLPTGMVYRDSLVQQVAPLPAVPKTQTRPVTALCAHRVRQGDQWDLRRQVTHWAQTHWQPWCSVLTEDIPEPDFMAQMQRHAFVLCVEGGGLDPSPKAWQSLLCGAIPILRRTPTTEAYADFPVAFVEAWHPEVLSQARLQEWHRALAPQFDTPQRRAALLLKLGAEYWWQKIEAHTRPREHHDASPT